METLRGCYELGTTSVTSLHASGPPSLWRFLCCALMVSLMSSQLERPPAGHVLSDTLWDVMESSDYGSVLTLVLPSSGASSVCLRHFLQLSFTSIGLSYTYSL